MRTLTLLCLLAVIACGVPRPPPAGPPPRRRAPVVEALPEGTGTLVLVPTGDDLPTTEVFLTGFCAWLRATPAVSRHYGAIYLLPGQRFSPDRSTVETRDPFREVKAIVNLVLGSTAAGGDVHVATNDLRSRLRELDDSEQYRCAGAGGDLKKDLTVLWVAHASVAPYGPGLQFIVGTARSAATIPTMSRGFKALSGDLSVDARHLAAEALATGERAIAVDASIDAPPAALCRTRTGYRASVGRLVAALRQQTLGEAAEDDSLDPSDRRACIYQPSTVTVHFDYQDTPFLLAREIEASPVAAWSVTRTKDALDISPAAASVIKGTDRPGGLDAEVHFRFPGQYRITASFHGGKATTISRQFVLDFQVASQSVLALPPQADPKGVRDSVRAMKATFSHAVVWNERHDRPVVGIGLPCNNIFLHWCSQPSRASLEAPLRETFERLRQLSAASVDELFVELRTSLLSTSIDKRLRDSSTALDRAYSYDELRDLLHRSFDEDPDVGSSWCRSLAKAIKQGLHDDDRGFSSRINITPWERHCRSHADAVIKTFQSYGRPVTTFELSAHDGQWIRPMSEGAVELADDTEWVSLRNDDRQPHAFAGELITVDEDGAGGDTIQLDVIIVGGGPVLELASYAGAVRYQTLSGGQNWDLATGVSVRAPMFWLLAPYAELDAMDAGNTDRRVGIGVIPYCLITVMTGCYNSLVEFRYAAAFDGWDYHHGELGFRLGTPLRLLGHLRPGWAFDARFGLDGARTLTGSLTLGVF